MNDIAVHATGLLITSTGIFAFILLLFAQRHLKQPARSAYGWITFGLLFGIYSVTRVWLTYAATDVFAGGQVPIQNKFGALVAGALMILIVGWQLLRFRHEKEIQNNKLFAIGILFTTLTLSMYAVNFFRPIGFTHVIIMTGVGIVGFLLPGFAAYKLRARYPGTGMEALMVVGGLITIIVAIVLMTTTNLKAQRNFTQNQLDFFTQIVQKQSKTHFTKEAFDPQQKNGQTQLAAFINEVDLPELRRVKIIRADGLVLASDLTSLVGTKILLIDELARAMKGETTFTAASMPSQLLPTEQQLGSVLVATIPLEVTASQKPLGAAQLFLDAASTDVNVQTLQNAITLSGIMIIITTILVLLMLLYVFRRKVSHPFAEILDEVQHIHSETESGEHRRLKVHHASDFTAVADSFNRLINEYEEKIRELKKKLQDKGWQE